MLKKLISLSLEKLAKFDENLALENPLRIGNILMVGDGKTSITDGNPPLAPRVIQCAAQMAEIVLDLTLGLPIRN